MYQQPDVSSGSKSACFLDFAIYLFAAQIDSRYSI